ncbi:MAG: hypothetical protein UT84_C0021G0011 [Candidatus Curtissbacteria bacterium GW2011_GWA1_40_16]|uniref:HicB-like antitoxin of toxin-antitoxin system domain-containing protein n=1 Tax=Candidatus Curtissbacteria bacterium GW2011_GWA1_40_16 TaxID=1618405 RepID=A0A0G0TRN4_9BACT|nr:MAG: hypothetical protein UT84_C0021G0011 [Candidatus Curtissbacteria bacterium GW2011_GWA1_40_16]
MLKCFRYADQTFKLSNHYRAGKARKKTVYNAFCPTLGVADWGDSIDAVLKSIKDGIELALESLTEEGKEIPVDKVDREVVATAQVHAPAGAKLRFA